MALTAVTGERATWWSQTRPGSAPGGTVYTGLVSDLIVNDYLPGMRATVTATGATTGGNRALTLRRDNSGFTFSASLPAASTLLLVRP